MLEVKNLSKKINGFELKNISFKLEKGYIMGFVGPNASGKSTTIKLIMNLLKKDFGEINIFGKDHIEFEKEIKDRIGFVYDESYFYEDLTMDQMKNIIAPFYSKWDEKIFSKYMEEFGLDIYQNIKDLSKGMKMKFALALALSHHADLIIMDEPTSGLDPRFRREILDILYDVIQDENKSIFFSTHITTDLDKIADYITFIDQGEMVFSKSKDEILETYSIVKGGNDLLDENVRREFIGLRETDVGFEGLTKDIKDLKSIFENKAIFEIPTLEDIMIYSKRS